MIKARMRAYKKVGISTLRLDPVGDTLKQRLDTLGQALDLLRTINEE
jgi:ABC-type molybdate transport system substrate-binding protein